jgi:hypothetical protein
MNALLLAEDAPPAQPPGGMFGSPMFPFFLIGLMLLFWVVVILPMSRRQKRDQEQLLATLKRGVIKSKSENTQLGLYDFMTL